MLFVTSGVAAGDSVCFYGFRPHVGAFFLLVYVLLQREGAEICHDRRTGMGR